MDVFGMIVCIFLIANIFLAFVVYIRYKKTLLKRRYYRDTRHITKEIALLKKSITNFSERIEILESLITSEKYELEEKFRSL